MFDLWLSIAVYNALLGGMVLLSLWLVGRGQDRPDGGPGLAPLLLSLATAGFAIVLAPAVSVWFWGLEIHFFFSVINYWCWGLFVHGPVMGLGIGALLRRRKHPALAGLFAALGVVLGAIGIQAFLIEPRWLTVREVELTSPRLNEPLTIAVLADIQTDDPGPWELSALTTAMEHQPDLVVLPGDFVQVYGDRRPAAVAAFREVLEASGLSAPLGVYAVGGNVDPPTGFGDLYEGTAVTAWQQRVNRSEIRPGVLLTGLDLVMSQDALPTIEGDGRFHIAFGHAPDFALGEVDADLLIAGHTHGGQVQLPFYGPPLTLTRVPTDWAHGVTALPDQPGLRTSRTLVVSRGVGMERATAPRLRFLCRPEVVIVRIQPA